jgi:hypothetical protein
MDMLQAKDEGYIYAIQEKYITTSIAKDEGHN